MGLRDVEQCIQEPEEDFSPFGYAGNMVIHQLGQRSNGDLMCSPISKVVEQYVNTLPRELEILQGGILSVDSDRISVKSRVGYACALAGDLPEQHLVEMDIQANGREVGIVLGATETFVKHGLFLRLQLNCNRLQVMSGLREIGGFTGYCMPFAIEMEKFVDPDERGMYHVVIMQDQDVICIYINGEAISVRAQNARHGKLGLYAYDADATFYNVSIKEMN